MITKDLKREIFAKLLIKAGIIPENFYGNLTIVFENGKVVLIKKMETIKV